MKICVLFDKSVGHSDLSYVSDEINLEAEELNISNFEWCRSPQQTAERGSVVFIFNDGVNETNAQKAVHRILTNSDLNYSNQTKESLSDKFSAMVEWLSTKHDDATSWLLSSKTHRPHPWGMDHYED